MSISRVGPKGQIVVPRDIRAKLNIVPGERVVFDVKDEKLIVTPVHTRTVADLVGILRTPKSVDAREGRKEYQDHLVAKLKDGRTDA